MIIIVLLAFSREVWVGGLVSPVADRYSRDQEKMSDHVVRMASVRNKTAEIAEGRGGSVKKLLRYSHVLCG